MVLVSVHRQRTFFVSVAGGYLLLMACFAIYRSADRRSVLSGSNLNDSPTNSASESIAGLASKLQIRDFTRYEMRGGRLGWEVHAKDAKLYVKDGISHINDAKLILHREKGEGDVTIFAQSAELEMGTAEIRRALLSGDVRIEEGREVVIHTESAEYDVVNKVIRSPAKVVVDGQGFALKGDRMEYPLALSQLSLFGNVSSKFESGLKAPEHMSGVPGK